MMQLSNILDSEGFDPDQWVDVESVLDWVCSNFPEWDIKIGKNHDEKKWYCKCVSPSGATVFRRDQSVRIAVALSALRIARLEGREPQIW